MVDGSRMASSSFFNRNIQQFIAGRCIGAGLRVTRRELLEHIHPAQDFTEDRIFAVKLCRRRIRNEELAPAGIRSRVDHRHHAGLVELERWIELGHNIVTRVSLAGSTWISGLRKEIRYHAMEGDIVV